MRLRLASRFQAWGCALLVSWSAFAFAQETPEQGPPTDDPLVVKPTTVSGKFDAVLLMLKLARTDLAKYYLQQTLEANPSDEELLELRKTHGTGTFLELTAIPELEPAAEDLLNRLNAAVQRQVNAPGYAAGLLKKLDGSPRERAEALTELRHLGSYAVPPILQSLARQPDANPEGLTVTLTQLGGPAVPPLIGALASPNERVRAVAARVLGSIGSREDAIWLWFPAFSEDEPTGSQVAARESLARLIYGDAKATGRISSDGAARKLLAAATKHLNGQHHWPELYDDVGVVPVWTWDAEEDTVVEHEVSKTQASVFLAERLAREATQLAPDLQQGPVILLAALLTREVEQEKWNFPLPATPDSAVDLAIRCGPELCKEVLRYALDQKLTAAALGSLQALKLNGSQELLASTNPHGVFQDALNAPESRIQFAAATTILHWEPTRPFRGSRRVVEILARTLNADSNPASVVVDPNLIRANATAGLFTELGYRASMAPTGMEGFRIAAERGNIELAVLHPNVVRWGLSQTIANLRADARTASIPVVIYGPAEIHDELDRYEDEFQNVVYVNEANVPLEIHRDLSPLLAKLSPPPLTAIQRKEQIEEAAFWLRRIAIRDVPDVFNLAPAQDALISAANRPDLAEDALVAMGAIGSRAVQEDYLKIATAPAVDDSIRQLAASQLAFHIQRYGLLISPDQMSSLKTAFQNEQNPQVRTALGSVIGVLKPTPEATRLELLKQPQSSAPVESAGP